LGIHSGQDSICDLTLAASSEILARFSELFICVEVLH
jgi:hypothetical protein